MEKIASKQAEKEMKRGQRKLVIIDPERLIQKELKSPEHFVFRLEFESRDKAQDSFLVLKSSTLNKYKCTFIEESGSLPNLKIVFVLMDTNADNFFDKVQELNKPKLLSKLFTVTSVEQINRVLHAWRVRRAENNIASAYVENDELVVQACDLQHYRVKFSDFVGLDRLSKKQCHHFEIDEFGNHIYWRGLNVSIDLDVVRYKVDDTFRHAKEMDALSDYKEFLGKAIRKVMSNHRLTQAAIKEKGGPAARHLYRIAQGEQELTSTMIDRLANAHQLSSGEYIEELIAACDEVVEAEAEIISNFRKGA